MRSARFNPAPEAVQSHWHVRMSALSHSLQSDPDSNWAWLWRMRLRVTRYLLQRYGTPGDAQRLTVHATPATPPPVPPPRPAAKVTPALPESPDPFSTGRTGADVPTDQLRARYRARTRVATLLRDHDGIGDHVRAQAALAAAQTARFEHLHQQASMTVRHVALAVCIFAAITVVMLFLAAILILALSGFQLMSPTIPAALIGFGLGCAFIALILAVLRWRNNRRRRRIEE